MEKQLSRYLRTKERGGYTAVFHELHPVPVYFLSEVWREYLLKSLSRNESAATSIDNELADRALLVGSPLDDDKEFLVVSNKLTAKLNQSVILYLMITEGCNFGCRYCPFAKTKGGANSRRLSAGNAIAGVNLWKSHLVKAYDPNMQYYAIFYGGEPLLGQNVIEATLGYIQSAKLRGDFPFNTKALLATNGTLIDNSTVSLCKQHEVEVVIGLDGPKTMNDILRVDSSGLGTYDAIIRSIELLVRNGISPSVSTSITPHNLPHLDSLSEFFLNLGVKKFGFNFLKGKELLELVRPEDLESYYIEASKGIVRNYKLHPDHHFEYQMEKKVVAFDSQDFFPVDCTCYGNQIVVTPSGQVTNCPFLRTPLGHVEELGHDFQICEQPIVKLWRERLPLFSPAYKNFEAKAMCGGGCAWSTGEIKGNISAVDDSSFIFAREVLDELIWSRFETPTRQEA